MKNPNSQLLPVNVTPYLVDYSPESEKVEAPWQPQNFVALLQRRALLMTGVLLLILLPAAYFSSQQKPKYKGGFQLLVEPVTRENSINELTNAGSSSSAKNSGLDYDTQIQVLVSPRLLEPIVSSIQSRYPNFSYGQLVGGLKVEKVKDAKILTVQIEDPDRERVVFLLDQLSRGYLKYSQQERQTALGQGIRFVDEQIKDTQKRVDSLQRQMQRFRQTNQFMDPKAQSQTVTAQITNLQQQAQETQKVLAETRQKYANLLSQGGTSVALEKSGSYQKLLGSLRDIENKIALESTRFEPENPSMKGLYDQRDSLVPLLRAEAKRVMGTQLAEVETELSVLGVRQQAIVTTERYWRQQGQQLPITARQFTDLERELGVATSSLDRFLQTREQLQVEASQKDVPWQMMAPPVVPNQPVSNLARNMILGSMAALLLSMAAARLAERSDHTLYSIDEIKQRFKLPLLGLIPFHPELALKGSNKRLSYARQDLTSFRFGEAFRSLYANLRLLNSGRSTAGSEHPSLRSLVITSAVPGDGKSTTALHFARAAAAMGQRVLLVDGDLRNPKLGRWLDLPDTLGLSSLLMSDMHPNQAIQQVPLHPINPEATETVGLSESFYVLTSGPLPLDPTSLLALPRMGELVELFATLYDLVIYDVPPVVGLADGSLLATQTDGVVLVAGLGKTDRGLLKEAIENLEMANISVFGVVANGLRAQNATTVDYYANSPSTAAKTRRRSLLQPTAKAE
jgi:polysaccharide biosynthesis transport protein